MRQREREKLDADLYVRIGTSVRSERLLKGVTQEDLASAVRVSRTCIVNLEAGRQRVPLHTLIHIARVLGVNYLRFLPQRNPRGS